MTIRQAAVKLEHQAALLAVLLLALVPVVGAEAVWSADVGAQMYQSTRLLNGEGWISAHPLPDVDPDGRYYAMHLAQRVAVATDHPHAYVALAKHPFLTWIVAGLVSIGGFGAVLVVSVLGTVAAAMAAGRITEMFRPELAPWALWLTGVFSPLFFDAYIGYAHTVAAAFIGWAMYWGLRAVHSDRPLLCRLAAVGLAAAACLTRTEGALAAVAVAAGVTVAGWSPINNVGDEPLDRKATTAGRIQAGAVGAWIAVAAVGAVVVDRVAAVGTNGPANPDWRPDLPSYPVGRWMGFRQTWLHPGNSPADVLIVIATVLLVVAVSVVSRRTKGTDSDPGDRRWATPVLVAAAMAGAAVAIRAMLPEPVMVAGLVFAFPALVSGLVALRRHHLQAPSTVAALVGFVLYAGAVIATQYPYGGVAEWGGRYFAAGLPLAVVAIVGPLRDLTESLPNRTKTATVALFAVACLGINGLGLRSIHNVRGSTLELVNEIAAATADDAAVEGRSEPLVVTTVPLAGRVSWSIVDDARWLLVDSDELNLLGERLRRFGIDSFTLVSFEPATDTAALDPDYRPDRPVAVRPRATDEPLVPADAVVKMTVTGSLR